MNKKYSEEKVVSVLNDWANNWPEDLWLFAVAGSLCVMRKENGKRVIEKNGSMSPYACIATIQIDSDGGDW